MEMHSNDSKCSKKTEKEIERLRNLDRKYEEEIQKIVDETTEDMSDEKFAADDKKLNELYNKQWQCKLAIDDLKIKTIKPNEWFVNFLNSFKDCDGLNISKKQTEIFERNLPELGSFQNGISAASNCRGIVGWREYQGKYNGKVISLKAYKYNAYLEIRSEITIDQILNNLCTVNLYKV